MAGTFVPDETLVTRLLRCLVEQAEEHAVILLSPTGDVMWCNRGAEHIFAISRDEFIGRPSHEILTDDDRAAGIDGLELAIARSDAIAHDDRWHVRADGSTFWSSGAMLPLRDADTGRLLGFGKLIRDRTDLKTRIEFLERQLESARRADEVKDRALTKLSHELRNVIGAMRGAVDMLDQSLENEQRRLRFHGLMQQQLGMIERLTQDLLDVKRAGGGKIALDLAPVVLQHELREVLASMEQRLAASRLTAHLLAPQGDIIVRADRVRLHQIIGNLLDNAVKYTPEGRIWVKLTTEDRDAVIQIEDTGRGIPAEMLSSIFELFTQVDTQASSGGLGVGLALVRELVTLHGGSVQASSKGLGQGSQFTVRLPLVQMSAAST